MVTIKMTAEDALNVLGKISPEDFIRVLEKVDVQIEVIQPAKVADIHSLRPLEIEQGSCRLYKSTSGPCYHSTMVGNSSFAAGSCAR